MTGSRRCPHHPCTTRWTSAQHRLSPQMRPLRRHPGRLATQFAGPPPPTNPPTPPCPQIAWVSPLFAVHKHVAAANGSPPTLRPVGAQYDGDRMPPQPDLFPPYGTQDRREWATPTQNQLGPLQQTQTPSRFRTVQLRQDNCLQGGDCAGAPWPHHGIHDNCSRRVSSVVTGPRAHCMAPMPPPTTNAQTILRPALPPQASAV